MKKIATLMLLLMVSAGPLFAQDTQSPDYTLIAMNISDESSQYYYPQLMERYNKIDTTLTLEDCRHLYYGQVYRKNPAALPQAKEALKQMNTVIAKEYPTPQDFESVVGYTATILQYEPFSITVKQYRQFCLEQLGRYNEAIAEREQIDMVVNAILSSGDGHTAESTIHVIDSDNEFEVLALMGYKPKGDEYATNGKVDYIFVDKNLYDREGVYFEVARLQKEVTGL